jgi:hypothetical protein
MSWLLSGNCFSSFLNSRRLSGSAFGGIDKIKLRYA